VAADWAIGRKHPDIYEQGRAGEWVTWEIISEERGRSCEDGRAGSRERARAGTESLSGGGYRSNTDPVASVLSCRACIDLRNLVDLASCSGGFLREQMRGFRYLLRKYYMFLRNVGSHKIYMAPHPRRRYSP
jgi:hypothetical protein